MCRDYERRLNWLIIKEFTKTRKFYKALRDFKRVFNILISPHTNHPLEI